MRKILKNALINNVSPESLLVHLCPDLLVVHAVKNETKKVSKKDIYIYIESTAALGFLPVSKPCKLSLERPVQTRPANI